MIIISFFKIYLYNIIGAKIRIIASFHAPKAVKFIFLKKNDKKVTKIFGGFTEIRNDTHTASVAQLVRAPDC